MTKELIQSIMNNVHIEVILKLQKAEKILKRKEIMQLSGMNFKTHSNSALRLLAVSQTRACLRYAWVK